MMLKRCLTIAFALICSGLLLGQDSPTLALAKAELQSSEKPASPSLFFNALNAVSTLITKDPPAAKRTVLQLAGRLRRLLAESETQEVPLAQEIAFARSYLEIEQVRLSNRLAVDISVDPRIEKALVPHRCSSRWLKTQSVMGSARRPIRARSALKRP